MKKRFYLEINYDFYSDEEERELKEIKNEIADVILSDYKRVLKENEELKNDYENLNNSVVVKNHCIKNSIPVQKVKDLKDRILKNEEYTVVLEGDKEFPDSTIEATFEKYINLKVLDKLLERRE